MIESNKHLQLDTYCYQFYLYFLPNRQKLTLGTYAIFEYVLARYYSQEDINMVLHHR